MAIQKLISLLLIALFVVIAPAFGQQPVAQKYVDDPNMPAGKPGQIIQTLIESINSKDPATYQRFLEDYCSDEFRDLPMQQHLNNFNRFARETGGIEFHSVRNYEPKQQGRLVVIAKDKNYDSWRGIILMLDPSNDGLVAGMQLAPARTPSDVVEKRLSEKETIEKISATLKRLVDSDTFSGTALIAKGDNVLLEFAGGEASKRFHVKNNMDTRFNLGSMNKMFTSTAINQLVEQKKISLDDTIEKYVDQSWLPAEMTSKIKIRHLLSHTSGLGSYFNQDYFNGSRERFRNVDDFKELVQDETLAFEPGERFQYSNTGMLLLGVVIEQVSGENYFDYIRENIYKPAGMALTDSYAMDEPVENLAIGYIPDPESAQGYRNNIFRHVIKGGPAGGGFSTVGDLHKFARALQNGNLVSKESLNEMWTDQSDSGYGFGFIVSQSPTGTIVGHSGGFPGLNGQLDLYVDNGFVVSVLSNYDGGASPVATYIRQQIALIESDKKVSDNNP
jgi:CubicO group peptidase (beta-lactamase class C family)